MVYLHQFKKKYVYTELCIFPFIDTRISLYRNSRNSNSNMILSDDINEIVLVKNARKEYTTEITLNFFIVTNSPVESCEINTGVKCSDMDLSKMNT